jgi:outer membrane protein assembly factor BamB
VVSSPAIGAHGAIYFGSHDHFFYALAPDGKKLWEYKTGGPVISSPALGEDGGVYFTSVDGFLYALNPDGGLRWRLRTGSATQSSPVVSPESKVFVGVNAHLWSVSARGEKLWQRLEQGTLEATPMLLADDTVCFVSTYGMLHCLLRNDVRCDDVKLKWALYLHGHGFASPGIGADGTIYTSGKWVGFYALPMTAPLAKSPWPKFRGNARNTGNIADHR